MDIRSGCGYPAMQLSNFARSYFVIDDIPCHSDEHLTLIKRALTAKFTQHDGSKCALLATNNAVLTHSIGKNKKTSLKANDFCRFLTEIREDIRKEKK